MRRFLAIILLFGLSVPRTDGATLHVPSEYPTINAALDAAVTGDIVSVAPGTYSQYETRVIQGPTVSSIAFLKGGVSLVGEGGRDATRLDLAGQGVGTAVPVWGWGLYSGPGAVLVQGFTITGAPAGNHGMFCSQMDHIIIRGCRFQDLDAYGLFSFTDPTQGRGGDLEVYETEFLNCSSLGIGHSRGDIVLDGCRFIQCPQGGVWASGSFIDPFDPFDATVRNCEFRDGGSALGLNAFATVTVEGCAFISNQGWPSALWVDGLGGTFPGPYQVRRNLFALNTYSDGEAISWAGAHGTFEQNTLVGNEPRALYIEAYELQLFITLRQNIFASNIGSEAVQFIGDPGVPQPVSTCNDYWNNLGGNGDGFSAGPTDLFLDPQFCDEPGGDYRLYTTSPCSPPHSQGCGQIGVYGAACGPVAIEAESWARMKARYREDTKGR